MVGMTAASAIFGIILTSGVAIYRSCTAADDFSSKTVEQLRAVDYISRDLHSAVSATIPGSATLALTLPDCYASYDGEGIPTSVPVDPVIVNGVPVYGNAAQPVSVTYFLNGDALIREQTVAATAQTTRLVVATGVSAFTPGFVAASTVVKFSITFVSKPHEGIAALQPPAIVSATVAARMLRTK